MKYVHSEGRGGGGGRPKSVHSTGARQGRLREFAGKG